MEFYKKYNLTREEYAAYMIPKGMYHSVEDLAKITQSGNKIFCFGVGKASEIFCEYAKHSHFNFKNLYFVDNDVKKVGKSVYIGDEKIDIISKEQMISDIGLRDIILITTYAHVAVNIHNEILREAKFKENSILLFKIAPSYNANEKLVVGAFKIEGSNTGICPICEKETVFKQFGLMPRYEYLCTSCYTEPRARALVNAVNIFVPNWKELLIHESSATGKTMEFFKDRCPNYSASQYFSNLSSGEVGIYNKEEWLCQDLENMSFEDEVFDVFITQDVFEHVFNPQKAFSEIGRVLKKGGVHIFTIPWCGEYINTRCRARIGENGDIVYLEKPMYHGGTTETSSIVTNDYGQDIVQIIYENSGMVTTIFRCENKELGLAGDFLEVFISRKL